MERPKEQPKASADPSSAGPLASPSSIWQWQQWQGWPYLTCQLLGDWQHGFFTQQCWPQPPGKLTQALSDTAQLYRVKQVHGKIVRTTDGLDAVTLEAEQNPNFEHADGLVTTAAHQAVWVCSADCTPALVGDVRTGQASAVHAGWRGTAARILPEAIAKLQAQGSCIDDLRVALGPAIDGSVYQVAEAVAVQTGQTVVDPPLDPTVTPTEEQSAVVLQQLQSLAVPPVLSDPDPGKVKLDVRRINVLQLQQLGLDPGQISVAPHCTYQEPERFFSYRRTGEKKVQWSGIVSHAQ